MEKFERLDPNDPDNDEIDDEDEEEEDDDDPREARSQGVGAMPAVAAPAVVQAARRDTKPETGRGKGSEHRGQQVRKRGRVPEGTTTPSQADLLWLDILQRKEIISRGIQAEHFSIKVARLDAGQEIYITAIDGNRCGGDGTDGSAGEALMRILTDEIHWHSSKGLPATYQLTFTFKRGGTIYDKGKIRLLSNAEIGQMRSAAQGLGQPPQQQHGYPQQPPPYGPQGYGAPPQYGPGFGNGYPPPQFGFPPYGYPPPHPGYPGLGATPPAPSTGDEVTDLKEQVRSLSEMVRDMWRYGAQGAPGYGPQGFGQPPQPQGLPMSAFGEMQQHLSRFGLTIAPAQQPGTAMVPAASGFQQGLGQLKELAVGVSALKEVADALNGVFNTNAQAIVEEPKPEPDFEMVEIPGGKWPNGEPIRYARDDKGINWFGTMAGNGFAMTEFGSTMAGLGKKIVSQINKGQGVGALPDDDEEEEEEQPQQQQQQQQTVVTPPPQNPPPPRMNGAQNYPPRDDGFSL
jgi:hypothetical protein